MKKITLFLVMLGFFLTANAQYVFSPIAGPTNVPEGSPVTINLNDAANSAGVTASSTGSYDSFSVTADWVAGGGGPWSSEADLTVTTTAGPVTIDPPTAGGANTGNAATLTFEGNLAGIYDPTTDGFIEIVLNQSYGGSDADWSNIVVTLFESPTCVVPLGMMTDALTATSVDLSWTAGDTEMAWNVEYNAGADFTPGNGEETGAANVTGTPTTSFSGLTADTDYFVYYQADCGGGDTSDWVGPFTFRTGYCESIPSSNDNDGINDAQLGTENFTSAGDVVFEDFTTPTVDLAAGVTANFIMTFATGFTYDVNVWIDFNNDLVYDNATELVFQGETTNANPTTFDASFVMPNVPLGVYNMRMGSADGGQATPNPCYNGAFGVTADFTINVTAAPDCVPASSLTADNITETSADLSWDDLTSTGVTWDLEWGPAGFTPGTGTMVTGLTATNYMLTGLTAGTSYDYYVLTNCASTSSTLAGPSNFITATPGETCANAFPMTVETDCDGTNSVTFNFENGGDIDANGENPSCDGFGNFGYFISFTAPTIGSVIINFDGAADNIGLEVYDACGGTPVSACSNNIFDAGDNSGIIGGLTPGNTYVAVIWRDTASGTADVCIEEGPACPFPVDLDAINLTESSADLAWTENGTATEWTIEWGPTGFAQGTGTTISNVTTNPFTLSGLTQNTTYDFYVQAACTGGPSDFSGPFSFTTTPQTNFTLDCTNGGPLNIDYCYDNGGADNPLIFTFTSNDGTPLNLVFNSGNVENNWDELVVFDSDGNPFPGFAAADDNYGNAGDISGISFQSTGDTISWYINSDGSVSCGSGSAALVGGINYTVSCATCVNPQATYTVIDDCANGDQFLIDVNITDLGDATSLTISNNIDANTTAVTMPGVYQIGPFPFLQDVIVSVANDQDSNCVINSQAIQLLACPPDNDNCDGAITATVNNTDLCDVVTPGTILAATPSGVANTCGGNPDDDVWFEFTALSEAQFISLINIQGGTTNLDHALYEGTCDGLTEIYCSTATSSIANVTVGNTYYIRVFSAGDDAETSTFDLCIREAPTNTICDGAENFCAVGEALVGSNIIGLPDPTQVACLGSVPNPSWNILNIGQDGLIEIEIIQWEDDNGNGVQDAGENGLDVDFALWGPFTSVEEACMDIELVDCPTCPNNTTNPNFYPFGNIIDCSYSAAPIENLTIQNAIEGEIYMLLVTNFSGDAGVISIVQSNDEGNPGDGTITAEIEAEITSNEAVLVDTGNDVTIAGETYDIFETSLCGFNTITIEAESAFADEYVWYKDGFEIPGETSSTLTVTESDNYWVKAIDEQCGSEAFSQFVIVNLYQDPGTVATQNITLCDGPEADGEETFDLNQLTTDIGLGADFAVRYYTNIADAQAAMNEVTGPYTSSGETLIIRIEDVDKVANNDTSGNCVEITEVNLVVLATPSIGMPMNLETCSALSSAEFTLTDNDTAVLNGLNAADYTVTYHSSETDAENGASALASPHNGTDGEIIHVRLEEIATGCYNIASFSLEISVPTQTATSQNIEECDDNDGLLDDMADFDLAAHTTIVLDGQDPSSYTVTYHTSQADADNNTGALPAVYSTSSTVIYVRVEDATLANCYVTTTFNLVVLDEATATIETNVFYYDEVTSEFLLCPESETGANLTIVANNFTASEVSVQWLVDDVEITGATELTYEAVSQGDYSAIITLNATGCSFTISDIAVTELENCVIPQGISPGVSPGLNDTFDLRYYDVTRLEIFNRNGTLVYSKDNYTNEWVGQTDDGEELPVGTYFYTMVYEGGTKTRSAWVYINR